MSVLLDTNIIINHLRGKKSIPDLVRDVNLHISVISYIELIYGAVKSNSYEKNIKLIMSLLEELEIEIINLEPDIAITYSNYKRMLENKGKRIEDFDLIIGCTALIYDLDLMTTNKKHFENIKELRLIIC